MPKYNELKHFNAAKVVGVFLEAMRLEPPNLNANATLASTFNTNNEEN